VFRFSDAFFFASRVVFAVQSDTGVKIFYALVAVWSVLASQFAVCAFAPRGAPRLRAPCNDPHAIALGGLPALDWIFFPVSRYWTHWIFGYFYLIFMSDNESALENTTAENSKPVSFSDAARFLRVDVFTFYSMVQREEIPLFLGAWGEFVVSQDDLDKLVAGKNTLC
jgi:hypothetical protein